MPPEPNDKMEKLLKAYAQQRRTGAGAPFEMHPATRQMLQAEIARRNAAGRGNTAASSKASRTRFFNLGRLFLYGSGLATAVICAALLVKEQTPLSSPKPALGLISNREDKDAKNKTAELKSDSNPENVKKLFAEADGFYQSGRYNLAYKRSEQILNIDPYNTAARKMEEKIDLAKDRYADQSYNTTRGSMTWQLDHEWDMPARKYQGHDVARIKGDSRTAGNNEAIQNKLNHIIIPKIEFRDATVREAINFLKQKSRDLDSDEADPARRGVNIVLKLAPPSDAGLAALSDAPAAAPAVPALPVASFGMATAAPAAPAVPIIAPDEARITLSLTDVPLSEALRYVTNLAGLKTKIASNTVTIAPLSEPTDTLITKEYEVPAGLFAGKSSVTVDADSLRTFNGNTSRDGTPVMDELRQTATAKALLAKAGVEFAPGATAIYVSGSNKLIVRNTEANLDLVDQYVASLNSAPGGQTNSALSMATDRNQTIPVTATGGNTITGATTISGGTLTLQNGTGQSLIASGSVQNSRMAQNESSTSTVDATSAPAPLERAAPSAGAQPLSKMAETAPQALGQIAAGSPMKEAPADLRGREEKAGQRGVSIESSSILSLFEIQLNGDKIRLIDSDGSIYAGTIDLPKLQQQMNLSISKNQMFSNQVALAKNTFAGTAQSPSDKKQSAVPSGVLAGISNSAQVVDQSQKEDQLKQQRGYAFHASGNSRSLERFIVVEGTYLVDVPLQQMQKQVQQQKSTAAAEKQQISQDVVTPASVSEFQNVRIQGEARIGNDGKIEINAVAVPMKAMKAKQ